MEGRPPFDPDDDLDFDFESTRRRQWEREHPGEGTEERPHSDPDDPGHEQPPAEPPAEPPSESEEAPFGSESLK